MSIIECTDPKRKIEVRYLEFPSVLADAQVIQIEDGRLITEPNLPFSKKMHARLPVLIMQGVLK